MIPHGNTSKPPSFRRVTMVSGIFWGASILD
jgi:hypothetical protein